MSQSDRMRIAGVRALEAAGYVFDGNDWRTPASPPASAPELALLDEADAMHALLVWRADVLDGCGEGSDEVAELERITDTIERYEAKRWPDGRVARGKT